MRPTKRSRANHLDVSAPWTTRHHRQRGHGPLAARNNGYRQGRPRVRADDDPPAPAQHHMVIGSRYGVPMMRCGVPDCPMFIPSLAADHPSAILVRIGHLDLIRNPRYPRARPDGSPSRPVILVPLTRRVQACHGCAAQLRRLVHETNNPDAFLPDGQLGRHEKRAKSSADQASDGGPV